MDQELDLSGPNSVSPSAAIAQPAPLPNPLLTTDPGAVVDGFQPAVAAVGSPVIINGRNFKVGDNVLFGTTLAGNVDYSGVPTRITAFVPSKAMTGPITVSFTASTAKFRVLPTFSGLSPDRGTPENTTVLISGTGFNDKPITVQFNTPNGPNGIVTGGDERTIGVTVPKGAATGALKVTTKGGSLLTTVFTVLPQVPQIKNQNGFTPTSGAVGTQVRVFAKLGTQFEKITSVSFKGPGIPKRVQATAFSVLNQKTEILAQVPPGAVTGPIRVQNETGADSTSADFVVL